MTGSPFGLLPLATTPEVLVDFFTAVAIAAFAIALPLVLFAVEGYRGSPWGRVISPLPWVVSALLAWAIVATLPLSIWVVGTVAAVTWGVASIGLVVIGIRGYRLFSGQVRV